jgi:putative PIN family toxin of toxin-antitoxin system
MNSPVVGTHVVIDTNIVLDLLVFSDPQAQPLREALAGRELQWLATQPMRDELERVLAYPQIVKSLAHHQIAVPQVLAQFDASVQLTGVAPKASVTCKDPDDQKFIDLAVQHKAQLLSKDRAVLCMSKRLLALGVHAQAAMEMVANWRGECRSRTSPSLA